MTGLRRHVPEVAIEWALEHPGRRWKRIDGTLCFADISGFTALSEKLSRRGRIGAEELVETLSRVFGGMLERARERRGSLLKFGGDALLFLFEGDGHARRAACTAVEMRQALRRAKEMPTSVGPLDLSMSVGLHSGTIHFFLVGAAHRELVLAGPDASQAAATESAADAGQIGLSPATAALLPPAAVRARADGLRLLRWRKAPGPAPGAREDRPVSEDVLRGLFPRSLGEVLAGGAPEPEHRVACIAFVRFSGTDALLEREGPDAVAAALDATIGTAQQILANEDITLLAVDIDRDGGKLFLASGVPQASEDDEGRMLRALRSLANAGTPLPLQLGVNRGYVFAAEVGTPWRAAYSAMGDTTNTAARICAKAPPGTLYAHPSVLTHSRSKYATEPAGPFTFKGKKAPQVVYRVGEERPGATLAETAARPLVGRREELQLLSGAIEALSRGDGGVVTVRGDTGLGKSRLVQAALERLDGKVPVLRLQAESYGRTAPYRLFRGPLRSLMGVAGLGAADACTALEARIAGTAPGLLPYLSLLGEAMHLELPESPQVAAIEPRFRQDRVADVVIDVLSAEDPGARVIVVEDAQWTDEASTHLLERLARRCGERPWLLLVTRRAEARGFAPAVGRTVELGPMPTTELTELIHGATVSAPLRPHELELVVRRAGGNPLFAEEIIRAAREVGSFEAVPDSLEAALAARVDALDPGPRRVLRYASVLGRGFSRRSLAGLLQAEGHALDAGTLARLEGFLESDGGGLRFRSGLLRRTVYEGLAFRLRARLHRQAGEAIEQLARGPEEQADSLALHFSVAGDHERTWRYARIAAERAARAYANSDAARLYRMALDAARRLPEVVPGERASIWTERGNACLRAGLFEDALEAYREAYRLLDADPARRAELLRLRAVARDRVGAFTQALRDVSMGTRLLRGIDTPEARRTRARLASWAAMIRIGQERLRDALRQGLAAAEAARQAGEREALAQALEVAGSAQAVLGAGGRTCLTEALRIYDELGDLSNAAMVRSNIGFGCCSEGRWQEAAGWFEQAQALLLKAGNHVGAANAAANCGELFAKQGRLDEAEPILREAIRVMRASAFDEGAAYAEIQLGRVLLGRGALQEADELLERVVAELAGLGKKISALEAATVQALARVGLDQASGALEVVELAAAAAGDAAAPLMPQVAESRAAALGRLGRHVEADGQLQEGLAAARRLGLKYEEALLLRRRVALRTAVGREPDPEDVASSVEILGALGVRLAPSVPA